MSARIAFIPLLLAAAGAAAGAGLAGVGSWAYQLVEVEPAAIAACPAELAVIDPTREGSFAAAFTAAEVAVMRRKPDGTQRLLLAYLSIGEAEDYRDYWRRSWSHRPPSWLAGENPDWPGNYKVRYWDPDWQELIAGAGGPLERILAAGFDGVYLDIVDAYEAFADTLPDAAARMRDWVARIALQARRSRPGFLVVAQNGEGLLADSAYLSLLDGIAKEDLWFGMEREEEPSPAAETAESLELLRRGRQAGLRVLTVDYVKRPDQVREAVARSRAEGFVPTVAVRDLDRLVPPPRDDGTLPEPAGRVAPTRDTPGRFWLSVLPPGAWLCEAVAERRRETLRYTVPGLLHLGEFEARRFGDLVLSLQLVRGLPRGQEAGIALPAALGCFRGDPLAPPTDWREGSAIAGMGEVELWWRRVLPSRRDVVALGGVRVILPTDGRDDPFGSGLGALRLELEAEREWGLVTLTGFLACGLDLEDPLPDSQWVGEGLAACGWDLWPRAYLSLELGHDQSFPMAGLEMEQGLGPRSALSAFWGTLLDADDAGSWAGLRWSWRLP